MVPISLGEKSGMAALDTGSGTHVIGKSWAQLPPRETEVLGFDWAGWPIEGFGLEGPLSVLRWKAAPLFVSDWAERPKLRPRGTPHIDAVISPQRLPRQGNAMVLDFVAGEILELPWAQARARIGVYPIALVETRAQVGKFMVATNLGDLEVDTGAPTTLVYEPRDPELPPKAVQMTTRWAHLRAGRVSTELELTVLEPLESRAASGGLLGMDVLKDCALALDGTQLVGRCLASQ